MIMPCTTQYSEYLEYRGRERERASSPIYQTLKLSLSKHTQCFRFRLMLWTDLKFCLKRYLILNTHEYTSVFDVKIIPAKSEVPSQEIWIFSVPNAPACPMNCSQNYILHVCFHLNVKHANIRQPFLPSFHSV